MVKPISIKSVKKMITPALGMCRWGLYKLTLRTPRLRTAMSESHKMSSHARFEPTTLKAVEKDETLEPIRHAVCASMQFLLFCYILCTLKTTEISDITIVP